MLGSEADVKSRLLVLMPTSRDSERTQTLLRDAHVSSLACRELPELCRELRAGAAAVLLTDEALFHDRSGLLAEALREQPAWSALPVLVLAREGWDRRSHQLSIDAFKSLIVVERPVRTRTLVSVVRSALRGRRQQYEIRDAILARERQAAELMAQDERLRFTLSAGGLGSWELDLLSYQLECSDMCRANFGRSRQEFFSYEDLHASVHPEDSQRVRAAIAHSIATGTDYDIEYRINWPNGEAHWVLVRGRATYDEAGRPVRMLGVSLDITERKRIYEALQQSDLELVRQAEELKRANQRKDEFLATLAHELRNPLAPIRTGMDLLARSPELDVQQRTLGVMLRQISHMVRLIDDLLDVSRITRGKFELKRQRISLVSAVSAAIEASRPLIDRKQHSLRVVVDEALYLDADLTRIAQVIGNLLNNASNYTPSGGLIELSAQRERGEVVIAVRDNGIGIPPDRLEDVFEMFSQLNRTLERSQGGLGIGLALVRSLVEMHGGSVRAESAGAGKGSTFSVRLPLLDESSSAAPEPEVVSAPLPAPVRVLVVDDNEDAADLLSLLLAQGGYQTRTAHDGPSALSNVEAFQPDIVILDIGLPGMSGYDVARSLRRDPRFSALLLIALTGWGSPDDRQQALAAGFDLHLTKPVDANALRADLRAMRPAAS